ncbi:MAG TPA: pyridoxamine 5'-phosphate oxidase family protein, partial [Ktedonobacteraceae bacterium]|nr:pyridoxamine 5'-phosphate oxidase family protein [Ktedonobacteraceae bacterium]
MSLGTCADGRPWVCEVHFMYDDDLNLYMRTRTTTRHAQEIQMNPQVAGDIVTQHFLNQKPRGVYFEGQAELLDGVDEN